MHKKNPLSLSQASTRSPTHTIIHLRVNVVFQIATSSNQGALQARVPCSNLCYTLAFSPVHRLKFGLEFSMPKHMPFCSRASAAKRICHITESGQLLNARSLDISRLWDWAVNERTPVCFVPPYPVHCHSSPNQWQASLTHGSLRPTRAWQSCRNDYPAPSSQRGNEVDMYTIRREGFACQTSCQCAHAGCRWTANLAITEQVVVRIFF